MDNKESVAQSIQTTMIVGGFFFALLSQKMPYNVAWGFFVGVAFSVVNFYLLSLLFKKVAAATPTPLRGASGPLPLVSVETRPTSLWKNPTSPVLVVLTCAFLKLPVFYGLIWFLLSRFNLSAYAFMVGFSLPFLVLLLKSIGQAFPLGKGPLEDALWKANRNH